ncbi:MAG TPA: tetratricopeptide repeat protein, partial [Steroidobacteraceae bacterium]|nr:tetratricopeptide repeat protein [Steroidobacteraceae bacterium]
MPLRSKPSWTLMFFGCLLLAGCDLFVSAEARVDRAEQHVAEGDYRAAMIELKNALQDQPDNVDARLLLSRVSLHMGDLEAAEKELERAVDAGASPEQVGTLRYELLVTQRRFADALTFLDADTTTGKADKLYYTAIAELGAGNVAAAREAASSLLASDPGSVRGHIQMAEVLAAERRLDDALAEVGKALELAPRDATALWTRGRLLLVAGRAEEAETSLVAATADPIALDATTRAAALAALSESHFAQQDLDAAAESIAALERVAPGAPGTRLLKARMALVQNRPSDAVAELDPVVQALPEYVPAQLLMATALISQGSTARAETLLKRVISRFPDNQQARVLLARIRPDEARDLLAPMSTGESNPEVD